MINKIKNSLAYRLPDLYKRILKYKRIRTPYRCKSDLSVLMMTGENHIDLLRCSVFSIGKNWHTLPTLIIASDGSISKVKILNTLNFWKGEIHITRWEDTADYHKNKNRNSILKYADKHQFGKKLALILHYAEKHPILWIDSDILFFKDFTDFIPQHYGGIICGGSEDRVRAYHEILLKRLNNNLRNLPHFNAGLLYVSGEGIYEKYELEEIIEEIHPMYDFLTEQTIFANIASNSLGVHWNKDIIKNFNDDNQQIKPMPIGDTIARHYTTNVRHLFWRDAFFKL